MMKQREDYEIIKPTNYCTSGFLPETRVLPDSLQKGICSQWAHTLCVITLLYTSDEETQPFLYVQLAITLANSHAYHIINVVFEPQVPLCYRVINKEISFFY